MEMIGLNQFGFLHNRSTTDPIFFICQILEKKWEYNEASHWLFIDFKKAYDSVRREVLYNILIEFGIPMKLVRLIKMCLTEMYSRVRVGKNFHWLRRLCKCVRFVSLCRHFLSYCYVPPGKCHDHFHILSSSLFSNHSNIQYYIICATNILK